MLFYDFGPFSRCPRPRGTNIAIVGPGKVLTTKRQTRTNIQNAMLDPRGFFLPQSGHVPTSGGGKTQLAPRWKAPENAFSHPGCWTGILRNVLKRLTRTNICVRPTRTNFRKWFLVHKNHECWTGFRRHFPPLRKWTRTNIVPSSCVVVPVQTFSRQKKADVGTAECLYGSMYAMAKNHTLDVCFARNRPKVDPYKHLSSGPGPTSTKVDPPQHSRFGGGTISAPCGMFVRVPLSTRSGAPPAPLLPEIPPPPKRPTRANFFGHIFSGGGATPGAHSGGGARNPKVAACKTGGGGRIHGK